MKQFVIYPRNCKGFVEGSYIDNNHVMASFNTSNYINRIVVNISYNQHFYINSKNNKIIVDTVPILFEPGLYKSIQEIFFTSSQNINVHEDVYIKFNNTQNIRISDSKYYSVLYNRESIFITFDDKKCNILPSYELSLPTLLINGFVIPLSHKKNTLSADLSIGRFRFDNYDTFLRDWLSSIDVIKIIVDYVTDDENIILISFMQNARYISPIFFNFQIILYYE
jgi:hypothetical protein